MDSLILTFNKEQMELYQELLQKENIDLNFNIDLQVEELNYNFDDVLSNIEKEAVELLKFKKNTILFSPLLTTEEIKEFIPVYYNTLRNINRYNMKIGSDSLALSSKIQKANKIIAHINKKYADFLPYKAALCNRDRYSLEIDEIDTKFKKNIESLNKFKIELLAIFEKAEKISNIVDDFIQKSSKATDEPKFKKFDAYDFFWSLEAFVEQIRTI